jgi:DNA replication and repair protein RecF
LRVLELGARGWRNLEPLTFTPSPRVTVLSGDNGQGKTNVIEAIYYLATLRSFRTSHAQDLIRKGPGAEGRARVLVRALHLGLERRLEIDLGPGGRTATLDGKAVRGAAAVLGAVSVVLFVPEDLLLARAAPAARRRFLDLAVFNVERGYYREAAAFQRVLKSRNSLLRRGHAEPALLDAYDEELARTGARLVMRRRVVAGELAPRAAALFRTLHGDLQLVMRYRSDAKVEAAADEPSVRQALLEGIRARRGTDERRRFTGFGPQTDDLELELGGRPAREHASQGQLRSLVLALKLAELTNVEARVGDSPVLLLDDVPSELDPTRRRFLFEMVGGLSAQTVISVTDRDVVPPLLERTDYRVTGGQVSQIG